MRFERYKEVEPSWLKEVPSHWDVRRIASVFEQRKERNKPIKTEEILSLSAKYGVSLYSERKEKGGNKPKEDISNYNICHEGDILVNCMNIVAGSVGMSQYYGAISPVYYALKIIDNNSDKRYMEYVFRNYNFQRSLVGTGKGIQMSESDDGRLFTVRMRIAYDSLKVQNVPIPPLQEQEQIANFLDWKINEINKLIEQEKKKIALFENLNNTIIRNKISEVSVFRNVPLKRVCSVIAGKEISVEVDSENSEAVRVFGSGDKVFKYTNNHLLDGEFIIFGRKGTIGKPYIVEGKLWIVDTAYAMKNNHLTDFKYLYYLMKIFPWEDFATNTVKPSIVANQILMQKIILPEIDVQIEVARNIDNLIEKNKELVEVIQHKIIELDKLKQSLISSVVTGKIDIRDIVIPEYEKVESVFEEDEDQVEGGEDEWD